MSSKTTITWDYQAIDAIKKRTLQGIYMMAEEVSNRAKQLAPVDTGDLKNSIRVEKAGTWEYDVIAGGTVGIVRKTVINYAYKQEMYNPNGHSHYMQNALNNVMNSGWTKYFKDVA